jgi:hypothetical protein
VGEALGLAVWGMDEAGPYTTTPYPGTNWQLELHPKRYPHEYPRDGTAKMLTLFHPATGHVRVKGVTNATHVILHGWLKQELTDILAHLPEPSSVLEGASWEHWGVSGGGQSTQGKPDLPPLRMLLIMDNLAGHKTPEFVIWLFRHGILPLYTPLGGSWLNMTESIQRILKRRALDGQYPTTPQAIMTWLEATARGWNADPTPFIWAGKRQQRRQRAYARRHPLGGSAAVTKRPLRFRFASTLPISRCA